MDLEDLIDFHERQIHLAFLTPGPALGRPRPERTRLVETGHITFAEYVRAELNQRADEHTEVCR